MPQEDESDPEADPEEDDDEDPEDDPVDYPSDGGDDGDDKDESSEDEEDDDEVDIEVDDDEEEEHPALADSVVVALPAADQAPSAEEIESFETDESASTPPPHPAYCVTARISIPAPVPTPVWSDAEVARLLAISTPPSSPLPQIPSLLLPPIPSPSLPVSPPLLVSLPLPVSSLLLVVSPSPPASPIRPLGYRAPMIWLRAEAASISYSLLLPPPLHLLSTDHREDRPGVTLQPRKRLGIALGPAYKVRESSSAAAARPDGGLRADYGFVATMDMEIRRDSERDDTDEIYTRLDDEQSRRQLLAGRLNMLFRDWCAHAQVMSLRTTVLAQQSEIRELQSADHRRKTVITEMLAADRRRQKQFTEALKLIKRLQTQMTEFERQQGPAKGPAQPDALEEAGRSS
ncbi:hypothetical protein Tco_0840679 [Tanacetum coccineum]|uniref:Uncharacterized protein n=1 Tax=Tanacetum coccineum TaxID=301880 RepID=A0ABQ5AWV9_9ASTR